METLASAPPVWGSSVLTVVQGVDRAGAGEGPQELGQDVHRKLLDGQLPQEDHGQRDGRVHVGPWRDGTG